MYKFENLFFLVARQVGGMAIFQLQAGSRMRPSGGRLEFRSCVARSYCMMLQRSTMSHQHKKHPPLSRSSCMPSLSPRISGTCGFQARTDTASATELPLTICIEIADCILLLHVYRSCQKLHTMFPFAKFLDVWHLGSSATIETSHGQDNAVPVGGSPFCRPLFSVSQSFSYDSYS